MELLELILFLLLCSVALGWIARRFAFPYPIALVLGGGAVDVLLIHLPSSRARGMRPCRMASLPGLAFLRRTRA